jgi:hypothetical protein
MEMTGELCRGRSEDFVVDGDKEEEEGWMQL